MSYVDHSMKCLGAQIVQISAEMPATEPDQTVSYITFDLILHRFLHNDFIKVQTPEKTTTNVSGAPYSYG